MNQTYTKHFHKQNDDVTHIFNIIVCTDINGGISKNGKIPWKIQEDFNYFKDTITYKQYNKPNIIIMGRNTYEQMNLIKGHINIIISTQLKQIMTNENENVYIFNTVNNAIKYICDTNKSEYNKIYVCGGKNIYDVFLKNSDLNIKLHWTLLNKNYNCDNTIDINLLTLLNKNNILKQYECVDTYTNEIIQVNFNIPIIESSNKEENDYISLMDNILNNGNYTKCRNGATYSKFGNLLKFNLKSFPLLTTKKMFMKGVFEELMYFIKGYTNSKHLSDKGVKIWEKNTTKDFIKKCNLPYEEYDMGPMYGFQWRHFNADYTGMNDSYENKGFDQLKYVMDELKQNPNSRRILMTTYNPIQAKEGVLFPCHGISIQFNTQLIESNKYKLNISQNQRSCDYFLGVPFNIASYALMNYMICHVLNNDPNCKYKYEPGELVMFLGDYHIYVEHKLQAIRQILRTPEKFPHLLFKRNVTNIEDFILEDIDIVNYNSYPGIIAEMIA